MCGKATCSLYVGIVLSIEVLTFSRRPRKGYTMRGEGTGKEGFRTIEIGERTFARKTIVKKAPERRPVQLLSLWSTMAKRVEYSFR